MDATTELTGLSGLQQLQAIFAGKTGYAGIVKTLDLHPVSAEEGFVALEGSPTQAVYNPLGSVHGGYAATLLDTIMGCAVHSRLQAGQGYTTHGNRRTAMKRPLLIVAFLTLACAATLVPIRSTPPMLLSDADGTGWKCSRSAMILTTCVPDRDVRFVPG